MVKGFKDDDGKFRPTEKDEGKVSSEQVRTVEQTNPQIDNTNLVAQKAEMENKGKSKKLPEAYSEEWDKLKRDVENRFDHDFNSVPFENVKTINEFWFEDVIQVEPKVEDVKDHFGELNLSNEEFEKAHTEDEIEDAKRELMDDQAEIIWGTLFEAKDSFLADKIRDNSEKIVNELGLSIIDMSRSEKADNYNTGLFIGVRSAGHDFFEAYWVPLYRLFGWI